MNVDGDTVLGSDDSAMLSLIGQKTTGYAEVDAMGVVRDRLRGGGVRSCSEMSTVGRSI